jgi:hypothetical protein
MATTTNFGWETPDDTDLVKDGALAMRTLGNSIDTSFVDLKGGTTGQVLAKASNTDLDFTWVAQDDSNAIQNALLTTTGDTIYASAASTPARLGIGSTGQVLTVAAGIPSWATPASGDFKLIDNTTFSAVTSFSRDSVFSATYDIYKIYIRGISSSGLNWSLRFRSGGTDTSSNYVTQRLYTYNTTVAGQRMGNTAEISAFPIESSSDAFMEITIVNPYASTKTTGFSTDGTNGESIYYATFQQTGTTSFDGYKFLSGGSETITGEQWVYGLKV